MILSLKQSVIQVFGNTVNQYSFFIVNFILLITMSDLQEFIDYVWSFYNTKDGLYPIEGITKEMILDASWLYLQMCCYPSMSEYSWGDGDTLDREHVRDIILNGPSFLGGN